MLELISIICSLAICILTPIEVHKIRGGRVRKGFAGDRAKYIAAFDKQLTWLMWVGRVHHFHRAPAAGGDGRSNDRAELTDRVLKAIHRHRTGECGQKLPHRHGNADE